MISVVRELLLFVVCRSLLVIMTIVKGLVYSYRLIQNKAILLINGGTNLTQIAFKDDIPGVKYINK